MKKTSAISRVLLGGVFTVFGLNGFLHFLPIGPLPQGPAIQFIGALAQSHYMAVVFAVQLISGLLLLINRHVPLALAALGAVLFNILLFHISMAPAGLPLAALTTLLWILTAANVREIFPGLLARR